MRTAIYTRVSTAIRERTLVGVEAARKRGVRFGRLEVCDRKLRERIVRLSQAGRKSVREIAKLVGVSKSTVARVIKEAA